VVAYRLAGVSKTTREAAGERVLWHLLGSGGASTSHHTNYGAWPAPNFSYTKKPTGKGPSQFYCSGLVWWAYHEGGVDINGKDSWLHIDPWVGLVDHAYVTPDDLISDPDLNPTEVANTTGIDATDIGLYQGDTGESAASATTAGAGPPGHVLLIDGRGRRTGRAANGKTYHQIPGAQWRLTPRNESVTAKHVGPGWKVVVTGRRTAGYAMLVRRLGAARPSAVVLTGQLKRGRAQTFRASDIAPEAACTVPRVRGKSLRRARRGLKRARCRTIVIGRAQGKHTQHVRRQSPRPGTRLPRNGPVKVYL
jgi:PASTA domain